MFPTLFELPLPVLGPITIHTYGVLLVVSFLIAILVARRLAQRDEIDPDVIVDMGVYIILAALVGAKVLLLIVDWEVYSRQFRTLAAEGGGTVGQALGFLGSTGAYLGATTQMALSLLQAGGVFYGGFIAAILATFWYARRYQLAPWKIGDISAPAIAIGHGIGRLGCFAAGCCYGLATDLPWGATFTDTYSGSLVGVPLNIPLHPTQLYEATTNLLLGSFLIWMLRRKQFDGQIFWLYVFAYAVSRFFHEFLRADPRGFLFGGALSTSQFIAIVAATIALGMLARLKGKHESVEPVESAS